MSRHKGKEEVAGQGELDFECPIRPIRRHWIQKIQIPSFSYINCRGRRVYVIRTATMKNCLNVIESFCGKMPDEGWYLFVEEIAEGMSKDPRTACRAIADCKGGGLLSVKTSGKKDVRDHYQIVWGKVFEVIKGHPETGYLVDNDQSQAAKAENFGVTSNPEKPPIPNDKLSVRNDKLSSGNDKLSSGETGHTSSSRARGFHHDSKPKQKPSWKPNQYAGWPFRVELPHLKNSESIERLWKAALVRPDILIDEHTHRVWFFALARFVARLSQDGEIANPGGYFHAQLVRRDPTGKVLPPNWLGEPCDYEAAKKAIAYVDCRYRETPPDRAAREGRRGN